MPFKPGKTGNPNGRPKNGVRNKRKKLSKLRPALQRFGEEYMKSIDYMIEVARASDTPLVQRYKANKDILEKYVEWYGIVAKEEKELNAPPKPQVEAPLEDDSEQCEAKVYPFGWAVGHAVTNKGE